MNPAGEPRASRDAARLLVVKPESGFHDTMVADLPAFLAAGDLLVLNDAATLPASLAAVSPAGQRVEIRLLGHLDGADWFAALLGDGDWRTPTELRDLPEKLVEGDVIRIAADFHATVISLDPDSYRMVRLRFSGPGVRMWSGIYAYGKPIQYSYLSRNLALWSVQTAYGSRPWAVEMPSAGAPLTWKILLELKRKDVGLAHLTHAAGISSAGDEVIDARLPFRERFEIPESTVDAVEKARARGGRIVAVGTTVVRGLEGCAELHDGRLVAGPGETDLRLDRNYRRKVVDGILTGVHDPGQSHFRLLRAFASEATLRRAWRHAREAGYLCHEFGDVCLILPPWSTREGGVRNRG